MKKSAAFLYSFVLLLPSLAYGNTDDGPTSVSGYAAYNTALYSICRMTIGLKAQLGETETECAKNVANSVKQNYPAAVKLAKKNRELIALLKNYREAVLNGVAGLQPLPDERKISYSMRQDRAESEITQLKNRIDMEE